MKLKTLRISNVRGIRDLSISLNGKNITVWGPNGTGKSGVVDAVDFLLTGEITRLVGKGTKDISLKRHGVHIDASIEDSFVEANIVLPNVQGDVCITRKMSDPSSLIVEGCNADQLDSIIDLARRGQHVLSRREILSFITAEPGTRANQIQTLLNIGEVERTRKNLQSISNIFSKEVKSARAVLDNAKRTVANSVKSANFSTDEVVSFINKQRGILNSAPIEELRYEGLRENLDRPRDISRDSIDIATLEEKLNFIAQDFKSSSWFTESLNNFYESIEVFKKGGLTIKSLRYKRFYETGIKFLKEEGKDECPLCEDEWSNDELEQALSDKVTQLTFLEQADNNLTASAKNLLARLAEIKDVVTDLLSSIAGKDQFESEKETLNQWIVKINRFQQSLQQPTEYIDYFLTDKSEISTALSPASKNEFVESIRSKLSTAFPKAMPEQIAWEVLIALEENLKALKIATDSYDLAIIKEKKANHLNNKWVSARDSILQSLYNQVEDKFTNLYRDLHGEDEAGFTAKLSPSKAALNFHVDFHGRGSHAPHALHSEGHQDSMGLCLFLALADYLAEGVLNIVLLDDVVMSVDAEHRRSLCGVLKKFFPDKQFIITTHDQTWANQLKTEGVTTSKTSLQFYNWSLEGGPQTNFQSTLWEEINERIEQEDIPGAAAKLRRGAEDFFETACDQLEAKVVYRQNRRWELGQFMPPAFNRLKELLDKSKKAANSWGDSERVKEITEFITIAYQVYQRTQVEQWGVNSAVHYNEWAKLNKNDFIPIKEAFEDLFSVFKCSKCDGTLKLMKNGIHVQGVKCPCGDSMYNLSRK